MKAEINVEFNQAVNRQEIQSGDEIKTLFGKLKKWLADLKPVAFSGSYNDLSDTPSSLPANGGEAERAVSDSTGADIAESFAGVKNDIAINHTTLGTQCKNLLKNTAKTSTKSGVTFTVNTDKSVTANGTNSTSNYANIIVFKGELEAGTYTLTGAVSDVFRIRLGVGTSADGYGSYVGVDRGNGYTFTVAEKALYTVTCQVESGKTASNIIFCPMLRYADITDDTYEPYSDNIDTRISQSTSCIAVNKSTLGYVKKNLLKNNAVTQTVSGVTFTINDDKSITVNGTATATISFMINNKVGLGIGNYILTGCPSGGSWDTFYLTAYASSAWLSAPDFGSGCKIENKTVTQVVISIASGYTANNLKFYPMLRDAEIIGDAYETYQPSLKEELDSLRNYIDQKIAEISGT